MKAEPAVVFCQERVHVHDLGLEGVEAGEPDDDEIVEVIGKSIF
jgi:hypothetical protein